MFCNLEPRVVHAQREALASTAIILEQEKVELAEVERPTSSVETFLEKGLKLIDQKMEVWKEMRQNFVELMVMLDEEQLLNREMKRRLAE